MGENTAPEQLSIEARHKVIEEYRHLPFIELAVYISSKLEETKYPTPVEISKWIKEHQEYILEHKFCRLSYVLNKPNKIKKM